MNRRTLAISIIIFIILSAVSIPIIIIIMKKQTPQNKKMRSLQQTITALTETVSLDNNNQSVLNIPPVKSDITRIVTVDNNNQSVFHNPPAELKKSQTVTVNNNRSFLDNPPVGLINGGHNVCFANALMQSLYHCNAKDFFLENNFKENTVWYYLKEIFITMQNYNNEIDTCNVLEYYQQMFKLITSETFNFGHPNDSFSLLNGIFNELDNNNNDNDIKQKFETFFPISATSDFYQYICCNSFSQLSEYHDNLWKHTSLSSTIRFWGIEPEIGEPNSTIANLPISINSNGKIYYLKAVVKYINNDSSASYSHYIAIIKINDIWYELDDSKISNLGNNPPSPINTRIIFYQAEENNSKIVLQTAEK
ncbi:hypothetical protein SLOPH_2458 [Spraguea lophii 42_110]|uniref:USP domain-containing protein n=1 Tax=Spraguea lophii (strain 42_110) TaxID=1358809 RepID=S7XQG4_SPRLO|nr:hypothetical protein SLOPH_2458 [Spraguea lophii 42_110]